MKRTVPYTPSQELLTQLETALHRLAESFWEEPYRFFTEADAVAALQFWVAKRPELAQVVRTADGFETGLLHREYPTFFRLRMDKLKERQDPPARRGHYDLVLIDPAYAQRHTAEIVTNRVIGNRGEGSGPPLLAAVEFKLFARCWNEAKVRDVKKAAGKLRLALKPPADVSAAYLCIFQRDVSTTERLWKRLWSEVEETLLGFPDIRVVVAVCWPMQKREPFVHYSGPWITTVTS
jgi:hypothetical protein